MVVLHLSRTIQTCTPKLMQQHWVRPPGSTSTLTTMDLYLKVFPGRMCQAGWLKNTKFGSVIQSLCWKTYLWTWILRTSLITPLIRSIHHMVHIAFVTSCCRIGLGNKQYISNLLLVFHFTYTLLQNTILKDHPEAISSFLVTLILGSDKTAVSVATGHMCYWPLYLSIGNIHNNVHQGHHNGIVLLGFLAILKSKYCSFELCALFCLLLPSSW